MVDIEFTKDYIKKGGEYIYQYRSNKGKICGQSCMQTEGCSIH